MAPRACDNHTAAVGGVRRFLTWPDCASYVFRYIKGLRLCALMALAPWAEQAQHVLAAPRRRRRLPGPAHLHEVLSG
jgi:hypothetical protein